MITIKVYNKKLILFTIFCILSLFGCSNITTTKALTEYEILENRIEILSNIENEYQNPKKVYCFFIFIPGLSDAQNHN